LPEIDSSRAVADATDGRSWWSLAMHRSVVCRAVKVCGVVGTLLIVINQGDGILAGQSVDWAKLLLTYLVPYGVSTFSAVSALRAQRVG